MPGVPPPLRHERRLTFTPVSQVPCCGQRCGRGPAAPVEFEKQPRPPDGRSERRPPWRPQPSSARAAPIGRGRASRPRASPDGSSVPRSSASMPSVATHVRRRGRVGGEGRAHHPETVRTCGWRSRDHRRRLTRGRGGRRARRQIRNRSARWLFLLLTTLVLTVVVGALLDLTMAPAGAAKRARTGRTRANNETASHATPDRRRAARPSGSRPGDARTDREGHMIGGGRGAGIIGRSARRAVLDSPARRLRPRARRRPFRLTRAAAALALAAAFAWLPAPSAAADEQVAFTIRTSGRRVQRAGRQQAAQGRGLHPQRLRQRPGDLRARHGRDRAAMLTLGGTNARDWEDIAVGRTSAAARRSTSGTSATTSAARRRT